MHTNTHTHVVLTLEQDNYDTHSYLVLSLHNTMLEAEQAARAHFESCIRDYHSSPYYAAKGPMAIAKQEREMCNLINSLSTSDDGGQMSANWHDDWTYKWYEVQVAE